jgi:enamine deaminase RidA (YjgF/YER057c/UK114 family)
LNPQKVFRADPCLEAAHSTIFVKTLSYILLDRVDRFFSFFLNSCHCLARMSSLTYINEPGAGQKHSDLCHYSQAVHLPGDIVKCAGQGGWTNTGDLNAENIRGQVDLAFENLDRVLHAAGLRGWEDVYLVRSYHVDMDSSYEYVVEKLKTRIPGHRPVWTAIAVPRLAFPAMKIEIEVEAIKSQS